MLVIEDELLVSMLIEDILLDEDCSVVGPFSNLPDALSAARHELVDVALLDVNLRGEMVYPVAEVLTERGIPFVFLSGYGSDAIPTDHPEWLACSKPFSPRELIKVLADRMQNSH